MSLMGVDVGTSGCKAVVFSEEGAQQAVATRTYAPIHPEPGRAEMDPEVLWRAFTGTVAEAASRTSDDPVTAIAISTHGESFVLLDHRGASVRPAVLNTDGRAVAEAKRWREQRSEQVFRITGHSVHPMYPVFKLQWLREHERESFSAARRVAWVADYLLLRLGLPPLLDHSLASRTLLFDIQRKKWSEPLLDAAELDSDLLPSPVPAGTVAGALSPSGADQLDLAPGTQIVVGAHDQTCGAVGMGAIAPGTVSDSLGSYECILAVSDEPKLTDDALANGLDSYCHAVPDRYVTIAYFPAGLTVQWYVDAFCKSDIESARAANTDVFGVLESHVPAGPTGISFLPHLIGSGTPHYDATARGLVHGLSPETDRFVLYKALLEGIGCELAIISQILAKVIAPFDTIRVSGGGARSALGLQLRATMTGCRIQPVQTTEAVCLGAAMLAGVATRVYDDIVEAADVTVRLGDPVLPDPISRAEYTDQIARHGRAYAAASALRTGE